MLTKEAPLKRVSKVNFLASLKSKPSVFRNSKRVTPSQNQRVANNLINLQKQLRSEAMGSLPREFKTIFENQITKFKNEALLLGSTTRLSSKSQPDETWSDEEIALVIAILSEAASRAFIEDATLVQMARSKYQSLIDRAYTRSRFVLEEADGLRNPNLISRNENLITNTSKINEASYRFSENKISKNVLSSSLLSSGTNWADIVSTVGSSIEKRISTPSRLTTIARTDGGRAVDEGMKETLKKSEVASHCSVVGCMGIEPKIPTYNGVPTCNITDVPVIDVDAVEFHINHTGLWVVSRYK